MGKALPVPRLMMRVPYAPLVLVNAAGPVFVDTPELGLSDGLRDEVDAWIEEFETQPLHPEEGFAVPAEYAAHGRALARRVALELEPGLPVFWGDQSALDGQSRR